MNTLQRAVLSILEVPAISVLSASLPNVALSQNSDSPIGMCINLGSAAATEKAAQWSEPVG